MLLESARLRTEIAELKPQIDIQSDQIAEMVPRINPKHTVIGFQNLSVDPQCIANCLTLNPKCRS